MRTNPPHFLRRKEVFHLLNCAWQEGKTSQIQLQNFVRRKTGTAPSPKLIVDWKRQQGIPLGRIQGVAAA